MKASHGNIGTDMRDGPFKNFIPSFRQPLGSWANWNGWLDSNSLKRTSITVANPAFREDYPEPPRGVRWR